MIIVIMIILQFLEEMLLLMFSSSEGIDFNQCPVFSDPPKPYSYDFIEMLSLWPYVMNQYDSEHGKQFMVQN
jgi:hypothetical protein